MPKKSPESAESVELQPFFFPGLHDGVVIHARDFAEAQRMAAKLRADVPPPLPS